MADANLSAEAARGEHIAYVAHAVIMPALLYVGVVGQTLNLLTLSQPSLRGLGYVYLRAIAAADLLSIGALVPFVLRHARLQLRSHYWAMLYHAHVEIPLINCLLAASTLCIVGLTVERYLSVCRPLASHSAQCRPRRAHKAIAALYATAVAIFVPSVFQKQLVSPASNATDRVYEVVRNHHLHALPAFQVYLMFREVVVRLGPIVVLIVLNVAISLSLHRAARNHRRLRNRRYDRVDAAAETAAGGGGGGGDFYDRERRVHVLLLITAVTFLVCTLPASVLSLTVGAESTHERSAPFQVFRAGANLLEVTSYFANFYLYALCSREYRAAFFLMLKCSRERRSSQQVPLIQVSRSRTPLPPIRTAASPLPPLSRPSAL